MSKQRYEREIEEILRKAEEQGWAGKSGGNANPPSSSPHPPRPPRAPRSGFRVTPGFIFGLSVVFGVLVFALRPISPLWSALLAPLAVLFFLGAIFYYYTTNASAGSKPGEKRWRGQPIEINNPNDPLAGLKRTLNRWFGRKLGFAIWR